MSDILNGIAGVCMLVAYGYMLYIARQHTERPPDRNRRDYDL